MKNSVILGHVPDLLSTIFVGSSIVFLILNFPQKKWSINNIEKTEITEKDNLIREEFLHAIEVNGVKMK